MITVSNEREVISEMEYRGLSTDTKPTTARENSLFLELDTGKFYYFSNGVWTEVGS